VKNFKLSLPVVSSSLKFDHTIQYKRTLFRLKRPFMNLALPRWWERWRQLTLAWSA